MYVRRILIVIILYLIVFSDVCLLFAESSLFTTTVSHVVDIVIWGNRTYLAGVYKGVYFGNNSVTVQLNNVAVMF